MKNKIWLIIAYTLAFLPNLTVEAKLSIFSPQALKDTFSDTGGQIYSQIANFGHIPYGQSLGGRLYYNSSNPDGCDPEVPLTDDWAGDPDDVLSPIFMVDIGSCSMVQ